jgi:radical SAM superfamily enzyme YgiQ (UPF0313 family)
MAYAAAILSRSGHDVRWTRGPCDVEREDVAIVLSSLVDYKNEISWAEKARTRGARVGFIGIAASRMPHLFQAHADFIVSGEPEQALMQLTSGDVPSGIVASEPIENLDSLPFPRWDIVKDAPRLGIQWSSRPTGGRFPLLASRGCPEFCTYCPHRILAGYRVRSVVSIVDEIEQLCDVVRRPYVIFRDPLFSQDRERILALCEAIQTRRLNVTFEAETRLDRLDPQLIDRMYAAGLRAMSFGVESLDPTILKKSGRRPVAPIHQQRIIEHCRHKGIVTAAFYVFGFLQDDWSSIAATIEHSIALGSTFAQYKLLTPYPGTPMFKQLQPLLIEEDWERYDGYTPTFRHPNLSDRELRFLLGAAYCRFYMRPSYLTNFLKLRDTRLREWAHRLDRHVRRRQTRNELSSFSRAAVYGPVA